MRWRMADDFFFGQEAGEATAVSMHLPPRTPEYVNSLDGKRPYWSINAINDGQEGKQRNAALADVHY